MGEYFFIIGKILAIFSDDLEFHYTILRMRILNLHICAIVGNASALPVSTVSAFTVPVLKFVIFYR